VPLDVEYKTKKLERVCTSLKEARKAHGVEMAKVIMQRIQELKMFDNVDQLLDNKIGGCHPLLGNRKGEYAMDLRGPYRLIFKERTNEKLSEEDVREVDENFLVLVCIMNIEDYH
jgi:proteic killer suppression protein